MNFDINTLLNMMSMINGQKSSGNTQGKGQDCSANTQSTTQSPFQGVLGLLPMLMGSGLFGGQGNTQGGQTNNAGNNLMNMLPMIMSMMGKGGNQPAESYDNSTNAASESQTYHDACAQTFAQSSYTQPFSQPLYDNSATQSHTQTPHNSEVFNEQQNAKNPVFTYENEFGKTVRAQSAPLCNPFYRIEFAGTEVNYIMQKLKSRI